MRRSLLATYPCLIYFLPSLAIFFLPLPLSLGTFFIVCSSFFLPTFFHLASLQDASPIVSQGFNALIKRGFTKDIGSVPASPTSAPQSDHVHWPGYERRGKVDDLMRTYPRGGSPPDAVFDYYMAHQHHLSHIRPPYAYEDEHTAKIASGASRQGTGDLPDDLFEDLPDDLPDDSTGWKVMGSKRGRKPQPNFHVSGKGDNSPWRYGPRSRKVAQPLQTFSYPTIPKPAPLLFSGLNLEETKERQRRFDDGCNVRALF
jgi:hypothetical protein